MLEEKYERFYFAVITKRAISDLVKNALYASAFSLKTNFKSLQRITPLAIN